MGYSVIKGPRELHSVRTEADYRSAHAKFIALRQHKGQRIEVHVTHDPLVAYVDRHSGWVVHCECGAGNSTDPEWGIACCYDCGAVHVNVKVPSDWQEIERLLLARPIQLNRSWDPHETIDDLRAQNEAHGVAI